MSSGKRMFSWSSLLRTMIRPSPASPDRANVFAVDFDSRPGVNDNDGRLDGPHGEPIAWPMKSG